MISASFCFALILCALLPATTASLPEPYLLFSTWFTVSRMNLDGSGYTALVSGSVGPQAVDYHLGKDKLFWTDYIADTIRQANLDGSNHMDIVLNVNRPSGLAVDWINDKVYFSYGDTGSNLVDPNHLAVYNMATGVHIEITPATPHARFHDLAVDPIGQKLYWTSGNKLLQSTLSGDNITVLYSSSCFLRYIHLNTKLYWTQERCSSEGVRSLDLRTLQVSVIEDSRGYYNDVAVYGDTAYWTGLARVHSSEISGSGPVNELLFISSYGGALFRGISVVHPDLQPNPPPMPYLLLSTWFTVSRMNLDGSGYTPLVNTGVGPQAVDYHIEQQKLFWTNYIDDTVQQASLDGSCATPIVSNVNRPSGLAVDWINDKVYFSYGDTGSNLVDPNHLAVYNMATGVHIEITPATPHARFHDLAVDPIGQKLYWTSGKKLLQSTLSGDNITVLYSSSCFLRYIHLNTKLYWTQERCSSEGVRSLDLRTLQVSVIEDSRGYYNDVAVYGDTAYWTGLARVHSSEISGSGPVNELLFISSYGGALFRGISVVHPDLQQKH